MFKWAVLNFLLLVSSQALLKAVKASSLISASMELCGSDSESLELTKSGDTSSMTITLSPLEHANVCKLRVSAPKTHVVHMQFIETSAEIHRALIVNNSEKHPPCIMSIYLPENPKIPIWKGDPCSDNSLPEVDLLTSDFKIMWSPPRDPSFTRGRRFELTAVGQGPVCKEPGQHTCLKIGWDPMLCVSDHLLCDGITNCPKSSSKNDEDEELCRKYMKARSSWELLAVEIFKKLKPPNSELVQNNKWLQERLSGQVATSQSPKDFLWREWQELKKTAETTTTKKPVVEQKPKAGTDSISQVLSKYGPWGYLMLGMLICGTVLMFCGLWECCFRKPKNPEDNPASTSSVSQPTTVLIINHEEISTLPPNYDDLDQPPSYTTLFPNFKSDSDQNCPSSSSNNNLDNSNNNHENASDNDIVCGTSDNNNEDAQDGT